MADAHPAAQAVEPAETEEQAGDGVEVDTEVIHAPSFTHFLCLRVSHFQSC